MSLWGFNMAFVLRLGASGGASIRSFSNHGCCWGKGIEACDGSYFWLRCVSSALVLPSCIFEMWYASGNQSTLSGVRIVIIVLRAGFMREGSVSSQAAFREVV